MTLPLVDDASIADLVDDTGVGTDGSVVNKAMLEAVAEAIDDAIYDPDSLQTPRQTTVEIVTARGTRDSLNERISDVIDENGTFIGPEGGVEIDGIAGEAFVVNDVVYLSVGLGGKTAGLWYKADGRYTYSSSEAETMGFSLEAVESGARGRYRTHGSIDSAGLTAGTHYYVNDTPGWFWSTPGTYSRLVAVAASSTQLVLLLSSTSADVLALLALTDGAEGSKTTIDARLDVSLAADGYLLNPYPKTLVHTAGVGSHTGKVPATFKCGQSAGVSGAAETTLFTGTLPANTLNEVCSRLKFTLFGTCAANANAKTLKFKFGAKTVTVFASAFGGNALQWFAEVVVTSNSPTSQLIGVNLNHDQKASNNPDPKVDTAAETLSANVTVSVTGQGGANNDIFLYDLFSEVWGG